MNRRRFLAVAGAGALARSQEPDALTITLLGQAAIRHDLRRESPVSFEHMREVLRDSPVVFTNFEAAVQTSVGGLIGVTSGLAVVFTIPFIVKFVSGSNLPAVVNLQSIFYSVDVSLIVGVLFGLYPARRAALLDPIEALRHE